MSKTKCAHCQLKFDTDSMIRGDNNAKGLHFCCNGCASVWNILHTNGFDEFYSRLGKNHLSPIKSLNTKYNDYELNQSNEEKHSNPDKFYDKFITRNKNIAQINLIIDGIHCSACIWLNEKALVSIPGVLEVTINSSNNKACILFDESITSVSEIIKLISSIGYTAYPFDAKMSARRLDAKRREFYSRLLVGIFCLMNIMWIAIAQYQGYFSGMDSSLRAILNFAEFVLATPVIFYTGSSFFAGFKVAIFHRKANMDSLIATGASLTYFYSVYAMLTRSAEVYFDSVAMIITFVFIGKYLELLSKKSASDTVDSLSASVQEKVNVLRDGMEISLLPSEVCIGDVMVLRAGDMVLLDGQIVKGDASFDVSSLSGEVLPIYASSGDKIQSGSICLDGVVEIKAKTNFANSLLCQIISILNSATAHKPKIEQTANKIASKFSFVVLSIAILGFLYYFYYHDFETALLIAISVIVISCPCALSLATPMATLVSLGIGLKRGIIFKSSSIIESLSKCDFVVFDKTGTLSNADLKVINVNKFADFDPSLIFSLAGASKHPISQAISKHYLQNDVKSMVIDSVTEVAAKGLIGSCNGHRLVGGSMKWLIECGIDFCDLKEELKEIESLNMSNYFFAIDGICVACFVLADSIRDDAKYSISEVKKMGLDVAILSGDNPALVSCVANELGISKYIGGCLPDQKVDFIKNLNDQGRVVLMVGDGINDAAAMSCASISVCMGSGADISLDKSDIVLLNDKLSDLIFSIKLSRKTLKVVKENLIFSLCYNAFSVCAALMGYVIPLFAAVSMSLSSLAVVLNSMRLRRN